MITTKKNSIEKDTFWSIINNLPTIEIELDWCASGNGVYKNNDHLIEFDVNGEDYYIDCKIDIDEEGETERCGHNNKKSQSISIELVNLWEDEDRLYVTKQQASAIQEAIKTNIHTS